MEGPKMQGPRRVVTPANAVLVLGALTIGSTLLWAMHEDAQHTVRRERLEQQAAAQEQLPRQPSTEQRRHMAAQFVCGHGVAYEWVNANTVECHREPGPNLALGR